MCANVPWMLASVVLRLLLCWLISTHWNITHKYSHSTHALLTLITPVPRTCMHTSHTLLTFTCLTHTHHTQTHTHTHTHTHSHIHIPHTLLTFTYLTHYSHSHTSHTTHTHIPHTLLTHITHSHTTHTRTHTHTRFSHSHTSHTTHTHIPHTHIPHTHPGGSGKAQYSSFFLPWAEAHGSVCPQSHPPAVLAHQDHQWRESQLPCSTLLQTDGTTPWAS